MNSTTPLTPVMKVVVIGGPTGVGKSALAFALASSLDGELISCDSVQVFKHIQIGANKTEPSAPMREHLLDLVELDETFTAADYYEAVLRCIEGVLSRGRVPIVVGGTGFYLEWLLEGRPSAPETDQIALRAVEFALEGLNWVEAWEKLNSIDPVQAQKILPNDWYRLKRALAVYEATGKPLSSFSQRSAVAAYDFRCFYLHAERETICRVIDERCEEMIERGLFEEVASLKLKGLKKETQAGRSIGYFQVLELFDRIPVSQTTPIAAEFFKFLEEFKTVTRQYSRKQENWFAARTAFKFVTRPSPFQPLKDLAEGVLEAIKADREEYEKLTGAADAEARAARSSKDRQLRMKVYRSEPSRFKGVKLEAILARLLKCIQ